MSPLRWTCKSTRTLAEELHRQGFPVSHAKVGQLLRRKGYSLQANRKTKEGAAHPDRNAQFEYINAQAMAFLRAGRPVVSVDTKKKELVGDFKNAGRVWGRESVPVLDHDFRSQSMGMANPYGSYDLVANRGAVFVGTSHDTPGFAAGNVARCWR